MAQESKTVFSSTQNWMNIAFGALSIVVPALREFWAQNPEWLAGTMSLLNIIWRTFITKKPISGII